MQNSNPLAVQYEYSLERSIFSVFVDKMVYCAAFDCNNDSRKTTGISYHCFPKDPSLREQCLAKISRADLVISKNTSLCSEYFTPNCYERDLQAELLGSQRRVSLKADAVPSKFSHRPARKSLAYRPRTVPFKKPDKR